MAATKNFDRVISADSHVMEPLDLWEKALYHKYGDRTPRVIHEHKGMKGNFFYRGDHRGGVNRIDLNPETEKAAIEARELGLQDVGIDPAVRVDFQERAGLEAEVMNTTRLLGVLRSPDLEVMQASVEVFNDWEAEFCSHNPKRLIGTSVITMHDVEWAVKELERTVKRGLRSPMIKCVHAEGTPPYRDRIYDRFWATAQELGAPITLHAVTGGDIDALAFAWCETPKEREENAGLWVDLFNEVQPVLANDFIFGGVFDRFPDLKLICSEFEMSWIPGFMARLDQIEDVGPRWNLPKLKMKASDYMRTRVWHGFIDDAMATQSIPLIGTDRILWGSDFPHLRSIGLEAQDAAAELLKDFSREDQEKMAGGNSAQVFNVN